MALENLLVTILGVYTPQTSGCDVPYVFRCVLFGMFVYFVLKSFLMIVNGVSK